MIERLMSTIGCVALLTLGGAVPAFAQKASAGDLAVGYDILHDSGTTFPLGWVVAYGGNVSRTTALVAEASGSYKSLNVLGTSVSLSEHAFLGGVRFKGGSRNVTGFGQALVGLARLGAGVLGTSASANTLCIQPGAGVDIRLSGAAAFRIQGDYRFLHSSSSGNANEFRIAFGVAFEIR